MAKKSRLDSISVPNSCAEDWNKMHGGEKSRFCGICEKNAYNISAMTEREADKLLFENMEKVCIKVVSLSNSSIGRLISFGGSLIYMDSEIIRKIVG